MNKILSKDSMTAKAAAISEAAVRRPEPKSVAKTTRTTIAAKIDAGFGNVLYLRGEGPGLSWDKGLEMECIGDDRWIVIISNAASPIVFKFLLNDVSWCVGTDYSVEPGTSFTLEPVF